MTKIYVIFVSLHLKNLHKSRKCIQHILYTFKSVCGLLLRRAPNFKTEHRRKSTIMRSQTKRRLCWHYILILIFNVNKKIKSTWCRNNKRPSTLMFVTPFNYACKGWNFLSNCGRFALMTVIIYKSCFKLKIMNFSFIHSFIHSKRA